MNLPAVSHPIWQNIIQGKASPDFEFLATKIFLGRAKVQLAHDPSPQTVIALAEELRGIFEKNMNHPTVLRDVAKLA